MPLPATDRKTDPKASAEMTYRAKRRRLNQVLKRIAKEPRDLTTIPMEKERYIKRKEMEEILRDYRRLTSAAISQERIEKYKDNNNFCNETPVEQARAQMNQDFIPMRNIFPINKNHSPKNKENFFHRRPAATVQSLPPSRKNTVVPEVRQDASNEPKRRKRSNAKVSRVPVPSLTSQSEYIKQYAFPNQPNANSRLSQNQDLTLDCDTLLSSINASLPKETEIIVSPKRYFPSMQSRSPAIHERLRQQRLPLPHQTRASRVLKDPIPFQHPGRNDDFFWGYYHHLMTTPYAPAPNRRAEFPPYAQPRLLAPPRQLPPPTASNMIQTNPSFSPCCITGACARWPIDPNYVNQPKTDFSIRTLCGLNNTPAATRTPWEWTRETLGPITESRIPMTRESVRERGNIEFMPILRTAVSKGMNVPDAKNDFNYSLYRNSLHSGEKTLINDQLINIFLPEKGLRHSRKKNTSRSFSLQDPVQLPTVAKNTPVNFDIDKALNNCKTDGRTSVIRKTSDAEKDAGEKSISVRSDLTSIGNDKETHAAGDLGSSTINYVENASIVTVNPPFSLPGTTIGTEFNKPANAESIPLLPDSEANAHLVEALHVSQSIEKNSLSLTSEDDPKEKVVQSMCVTNVPISEGPVTPYLTIPPETISTNPPNNPDVSIPENSSSAEPIKFGNFYDGYYNNWIASRSKTVAVIDLDSDDENDPLPQQPTDCLSPIFDSATSHATYIPASGVHSISPKLFNPLLDPDELKYLVLINNSIDNSEWLHKSVKSVAYRKLDIFDDYLPKFEGSLKNEMRCGQLERNKLLCVVSALEFIFRRLLKKVKTTERLLFTEKILTISTIYLELRCDLALKLYLKGGKRNKKFLSINTKRTLDTLAMCFEGKTEILTQVCLSCNSFNSAIMRPITVPILTSLTDNMERPTSISGYYSGILIFWLLKINSEKESAVVDKAIEILGVGSPAVLEHEDIRRFLRNSLYRDHDITRYLMTEEKFDYLRGAYFKYFALNSLAGIQFK